MNIYHFWIVKFFDFLVGKLSSTSSTSESVNSMGTSDIVLVAGGTGGVGRRVVDVLRKKGIPVRVLVLFCDSL
jgi:NADPH:quinone reductase-like Zn-dependent oxidoreductase